MLLFFYLFIYLLFVVNINSYIYIWLLLINYKLDVTFSIDGCKIDHKRNNNNFFIEISFEIIT